MTTEVASFDFDSTLSDNRHLWHLIDEKKAQGIHPDWDEYGIRCAMDATEGPAFPLAKYMSDRGDPWIIVSGRAEAAREASLLWLRERGLKPWAVFLSDPRHGKMGHGEWKALRLKEIQKANNWKILFHMDDISEVGQAVASDPDLDIPVILVHTMDQMLGHLG